MIVLHHRPTKILVHRIIEDIHNQDRDPDLLQLDEITFVTTSIHTGTSVEVISRPTEVIVTDLLHHSELDLVSLHRELVDMATTELVLLREVVMMRPSQFRLNQILLA